VFDQALVHRIDHFLGKEAALNIVFDCVREPPKSMATVRGCHSTILGFPKDKASTWPKVGSSIAGRQCERPWAYRR